MLSYIHIISVISETKLSTPSVSAEIPRAHVGVLWDLAGDSNDRIRPLKRLLLKLNYKCRTFNSSSIYQTLTIC